MSESRTGILMAGAAKRAITPPVDCLKVLAGGPMGGATECYEDIYARAIVLSDGKEHCAFITCELLAIPNPKYIRAMLQEAYGINPMAVIFGVTHNHQAPMYRAEMMGMGAGGPMMGPPPSEEALAADAHMTQVVYDGIKDAVGEAIAKLRPAKMAVGSGPSYINVSRDWPTPAGTLQGPNFQAYSDKELVVMKVEGIDGKPIAMLLNYGMHGNVLFTLRYAGSFSAVGGDIQGRISRYVERAVGGDYVCGWAIGAAGDQNPIISTCDSFPQVQEDGSYTVERSTYDPQTMMALMDRLASIQGLDALNIAAGITTYTEDFKLRYGSTVKECSGWKPQRRGEPTAKRELGDNVKHWLHLIAVNDYGFAGVNCEAYSKLGRIVKDVLPYEKSMVFGIEWDEWKNGYIPDVRTAEWKGFGAGGSAAADPWETEKAFYTGFRDLAAEIEK